MSNRLPLLTADRCARNIYLEFYAWYIETSQQIPSNISVILELGIQISRAANSIDPL